jgi:hypothetical protein
MFLFCTMYYLHKFKTLLYNLYLYMEYNYIFLSLLGTDHLTCRGEVMVFCFVQNFFFEQHELEFIFFLSRKAQFFFFHNSTLGYMSKTLNQIIIFFLHQNQNIFLEKKHNRPLQVKWSFP